MSPQIIAINMHHIVIAILDIEKTNKTDVNITEITIVSHQRIAERNIYNFKI